MLTWRKRSNVSVSRETARRTEGWGTDALVGRLNPMLTGWGQYYCLGPATPAYRALDVHVRNRLRRWLRNKHMCRARVTKRFLDEFLDETLELVRLTQTTRDLPWGKA